MTEDQLTINQIHPTSRCGNGCNHCGDKHMLNQGELAPDEIDQVFEGGFQVHEAKDRFSTKSRGKVVSLLGGGEPTYHSDLPKMLRTVGKYAGHINVVIGGLNPNMDLVSFAAAVEDLNFSGIRVHFTVSYHPYGSLVPGYDDRLKRTVEKIYRISMRDCAINVICLPETKAVLADQSIRAEFPYLSPKEIEQSPFFSWLFENFAILHERRKTNSDGTPRLVTKPRLDIEFIQRTLRKTGGACNLPALFSDSVLTLPQVEEFIKNAEQSVFSTPLVLGADGSITGCASSRFTNPDFYEGNVRGHSYEEILHNRKLLLDHYVIAAYTWLMAGKHEEKGNLCENVCREARERFAADCRRIRPHPGNGETVVRKRAFS